MSTPNTAQTPGSAPSAPATSVSGPHANGHLVSTGLYWRDRVQRLFIHLSNQCTTLHECQVYEYDAQSQTIVPTLGDSSDSTIEEHGWFRDPALFAQIATNHPVPNGQSPHRTFIAWRESLMAYLDVHHGGPNGLWTRAG
ncbi:hypothetical protein BDU57DRAFT_553045 [Ampelomyces quisqualis]|uniref:Uncharacterized protein n=1 Tax=Ampelomyces quisqualis TaxID=50730 RepID=A0A6A5R0S2_AMPQU|nr:hypothetical protein BDU57DRAFT_553045 [Ampelomyces quisqualis]